MLALLLLNLPILPRFKTLLTIPLDTHAVTQKTFLFSKIVLPGAILSPLGVSSFYSPYRIQANIPVDCISSYLNDDLVSSNSFTILGDNNLVDVCWATITAHSDYF